MGIGEWVQNIILKKGLRSAIGVAIAFLLSAKVTAIAQQMGITIDKTQFEAGAMVLLAGGIEALRAWLKNKYGLKFL